MSWAPKPVLSTFDPADRVSGRHAPRVPFAGGDVEGNVEAFVRVPVESAKRLRALAQGDVGTLLDQHLREKQQLLETNAALQAQLDAAGVSHGSEVAEEAVAAIQKTDEGVNRVLVLSLR